MKGLLKPLLKVSVHCSNAPAEEMTLGSTQNDKKLAFTLAEVLITLGIIGIVAAMTLPAVIADSRKEATAAKVKKFYNTINNALQFAIAEYGDVELWMGEPKDSTYEENVKFLKTYFMPYIKYNKYDNCYGNMVCVYMTSGGMFAFGYDKNGGDIVYFVDGKYNENASIKENTRNVFAFQFNKKNGYAPEGGLAGEDTAIGQRENRKTTVEPYVMNWDGTYEDLINNTGRGCNLTRSAARSTFCTKLLQMNDWKITDDFPW